MTIEEWPRGENVTESRRIVHEPVDGVATYHADLAARFFYLEGRCLGINAIRDER